MKRALPSLTSLTPVTLVLVVPVLGPVLGSVLGLVLGLVLGSWVPAAFAQAPPSPPAPLATAESAPPPAPGKDFIEEARKLYREVACGGVDHPSNTHCAELAALYEKYKTKWLQPAMPWLAKLEPAGLPPQVVYPFGGGDLLSALATYPELTEFTTISLEPAGDIRKIDTVKPAQLSLELTQLRTHLGKLFAVAHSRTENLSIEAHGDLPGQIVFTMAALAIHGYEPVSLRYFHFNPDGTLKYLTADDIAAEERAFAQGKKKSSAAREVAIFGDAEIQFRKVGDAAAPVKTLRHVAYNLDDKHLATDPSLLRHLEAKGKVTAMTKAASHLLWADEFSTIRTYLIDHMVFMISDSTGVPPRFLKDTRFVQDTYGTFEGPVSFGTTNKRDGDDLKKLFKANPHSDLPFRYYGYPDANHHGHVVVTRPK